MVQSADSSECKVAVAPSGLHRRIPDERLPRRRILVVDDKRSNAQSLEVLLKTLGQEVYTAFDGKEALEMVRKHRPDVVLLDIGLPIMDGYEVARRCREAAGTAKPPSWR